MATTGANNPVDRNAGRLQWPALPTNLTAETRRAFEEMRKILDDFATPIRRSFQRMKSSVQFDPVWDLHYLYHGTDNVTITVDATRDWRRFDFLVSFRAADSVADLCNLGNGNDGLDDTGFQTPTGVTQTIATRTVNNCAVRVGCNPTTGALEFSVTNAAAASRTVYFRIWAAVPAQAGIASANYAAIGNGL